MKTYTLSRIGLSGQVVLAAAVLASLGGPTFAQETALTPPIAVTQETAHPQKMKLMTPHQHRPVLARHSHEDGTADSTNWSGYAVTGANGSVTSVSGSWTIPVATCTVAGDANSYASFWIGIDGWTSSSVEQTGTDSDCSSGRPVYYAWYEFYPQASYYACNSTSTCATMENLKPGDVVTASVTYSGSTFTVELSVVSSTGSPVGSFTTTYTPATSSTNAHRNSVQPPARSSAEWITEAPCCTNRGGTLPLADFGTVSFTKDDATITTVNAGPLPIGSFGLTSASTVWESTMVSEKGSAVMAQPSALSSLANFSVQWLSVGP